MPPNITESQVVAWQFWHRRMADRRLCLYQRNIKQRNVKRRTLGFGEYIP